MRVLGRVLAVIAAIVLLVAVGVVVADQPLRSYVQDTAATTILGLVQELSLDPKKVAVERNLEIVPRSLHGETALAEGDKIELVQFVGGG